MPMQVQGEIIPRSVPVWSGVADFADRYDVFVLDLWGVLHDGVTAYPGAAETLRHLQAAGKRTVLLSNAPRRADGLVDAMTDMGLPRDSYDEILSSGEVVYRQLRDRHDPAYAALGRSLYHLGPQRDRNVFDTLDYVAVDDPLAADFVLCTGPFDLAVPLDMYADFVRRCAEKKLPMLCANPDRVVIREGQRVLCAGAIAESYAALGGPVIMTGKPDPAVYRFALQMLGGIDPSRAVGVGDSFDTDVPGCLSAGIDVVLCTGGVHAEGLGVRHGEKPQSDAVSRLAAQHHMYPVGAIPAFVW